MSGRSTTSDLYEFAEELGVTIDTVPLPENGSVSIEIDGDYYVGIDRFATTADERVHLAHELGHCARGAFYNIYSKYDVRQRYERQADEWAIERLVPEEDFKKAVRHGSTEPWQIAEDFNVPPDFAAKAMRYYLH